MESDAKRGGGMRGEGIERQQMSSAIRMLLCVLTTAASAALPSDIFFDDAFDIETNEDGLI